jgi:hypothetical protein
VPVGATSWKFFTEATVTRPWKFRHQHCRCSCHRGALFLRDKVLEVLCGFSLDGSDAVPWPTGHWILHCILLGPLDLRKLNLYDTCPTSKLLPETCGLICLLE